MSEVPPSEDPASAAPRATGALGTDRPTEASAEVDPRATPPRSLAELVRAHPFIAAIMLICTLGGALAGPAVFDEAWSLARQIAAGAFLGAWVGITLTVTKMIG